ncbi:MAG: Trp biosynthesis-associated membrane protein [Kineosporiaceae bacterium]
MTVASRLTRRSTVLGVLGGAGIVLLAQGRTWVRLDRVPATGVVTAVTDGSLSGEQAAPGVLALALVAAAGAVAVTLAGRRLARACAVLLALTGVGVVALATQVLTDPASVAREATRGATGLVDTAPPAAAVTAWVGVGLAGGAVITLAALAVWWGAGRWTMRASAKTATTAMTAMTASSRATGSGSAREESPEPLWEAIGRGEDPTD